MYARKVAYVKAKWAFSSGVVRGRRWTYGMTPVDDRMTKLRQNMTKFRNVKRPSPWSSIEMNHRVTKAIRRLIICAITLGI